MACSFALRDKLINQLSEAEAMEWDKRLKEANVKPWRLSRNPIDEAIQSVKDAQHNTGKGIWDL